MDHGDHAKNEQQTRNEQLTRFMKSDHSKKWLRKVIAFAIIAGGVGLAWYTRNHWRNSQRLETCLVTWRKGGMPNVIDVFVVDELGGPIVGEDIDTDNDSGGNSGTTDSRGRVSIESGEPGIDSIEIGKRGKVSWPINGLDVSRGVRFVIIITK